MEEVSQLGYQLRFGGVLPTLQLRAVSSVPATTASTATRLGRDRDLVQLWAQPSLGGLGLPRSLRESHCNASAKRREKGARETPSLPRPWLSPVSSGWRTCWTRAVLTQGSGMASAPPVVALVVRAWPRDFVFVFRFSKLPGCSQ